MTLRVYYEDTDLGGVVYHANYLKFIERARSEALFARGLSPVMALRETTGHFVVRKLEADFFKPARLGDLLTVRSRLDALKGASFVLTQEVVDASGDVLFRAAVTLAFLLGSVPGRIPDEVAAKLQEAFGQE